MPYVRTDDGPRKLRAVWLGPKGGTLPFAWTYVQWLVTLASAAVSSAVMTGLWWLLTADPLLAVVLGGAWGTAGGVYLAVRIMREVTFDEPVRYKLNRTIYQLGWRDQTPVPGILTVEWTIPPVCELSPTVRTHLGRSCTADTTSSRLGVRHVGS